MKKYTLKEWIEKTGHQNAMRIAGVTKGAVSHWKSGRNGPLPAQAKRINKYAKGTVKFATKKAD